MINWGKCRILDIKVGTFSQNTFFPLNGKSIIERKGRGRFKT